MTVLPAEPILNTLTIYKNISFTGFTVSQPGVANASLNGVMPHSNPNHAALLPQPSNLTVSYAGSRFKSLSLTSFYYGCNAALSQSIVSLAEACGVTVTGYKAGSKAAAATQSFKFAPASAVSLQSAPAFGTFSSKFQGLQSVGFTFTPANVEVLLIDDLMGSLQT